MAGAPPGGRSIFPRAPTFTLDTFSSKNFIVKDFVENLTESSLPSNRRSAAKEQAFDPKPLIRSFEGALAQLAHLSEDLETREAELQTAVRRAEIEHERTLDSLGSKLDQSIDAYESLEGSLNATGNVADAGGNVAVQLGEKLEDLDRQRQRALDAQFLVQCWLDVSETGELSSLEQVRQQGNGAAKVRCATIAKQLMRISQRLDPKSWQTNGAAKSNGITNGVSGYRGFDTKAIIEKFSETLEQDLLQQFDSSYRKQDFEGMMECAKVLRGFGGGSSVIALYVNQHQFFIDRRQLFAEEVDTGSEVARAAWDNLADPDADPPGVNPSSKALLDEVKIVMQDESFTIKRAFPYYEDVLIKFIQRVFQQSIQQRLEQILEKADTISSLAYLRSLHAARAYINMRVEDLKQHGLTEHPEPCTPAISLVLDQQVEELFIPYLMATSYIDREKRSLGELYSSLLFKYTIFHSRRKKPQTGFMASLAQQGTQLLSSAKDAYIERLDSSDLTPTQKAMMLRVAGIKAHDNKNEIEVSEEDGVLSISTAKRMLKWLAEAVKRTVEFNSGQDRAKDIAVLWNMLLENMGQVYVETSLDAANDAAIIQENLRNEPDLSYMSTLHLATTISVLMQHSIRTMLLPLSNGSKGNTIQRDMERASRDAVARIEEKTNAAAQKSIDVIIIYVNRLLSNQKKTDFRPRDADLDVGSYLEQLCTPTCDSICTFLSQKVYAAAAAAFNGNNLRSFAQEIALSVRDALFEHFKRFNVNATGGLMVTKDVTRYIDTLREWPLSSDVNSSLDVLSDISNIFMMGPEALKERGRAIHTSAVGAKGALDKIDFRAFVNKRDDVGTVAIQSVLAGL